MRFQAECQEAKPKTEETSEEPPKTLTPEEDPHKYVFYRSNYAFYRNHCVYDMKPHVFYRDKYVSRRKATSFSAGKAAFSIGTYVVYRETCFL